ncbi:glycosyltransferase family 39 protein [Solemya velum gill symbiont]|uniref:glycosyltransferase family 39 protein n=1 Tax=Solemya velum gill symbiont TaxID=2340 RepID=UPI001179ED5D|nr:glycosyltransferase family 39 protein [Solemya velum gill symbiont]
MKVKWNYSVMLSPMLFGLFALLLRLYNLDEKSIWMDEAFTSYHSTFSAYELWTQSITTKPPLYYLLTSLFWSPGDGAFALRLPDAILGSISVMLSWYLGRAIAGDRAAFVLALFVLLSDVNLFYSQEARHYILLSVGWLLLLLSLVQMVKSSDNKDKPCWSHLVLMAVGAIIMVHSHPIAMHYLVASGIAYFSALFIRPGCNRRFFYQPVIVVLLAGVSVLPWLPVGFESASTNFNWLKQPGAGNALFEYMMLFGSSSLAFLAGKKFAFVVSLFLVALSVTGILYWLVRCDRRTALLLILLMLLPPLLIWLTGFFEPMYMLRTIMPSHLIAMTGLALAMTVIKAGWLRIAGVAVLTVVLGGSSYGYLSHYKKEAWAELSVQLKQTVSAGAAVLVCEEYLYHPLYFYLHEEMPAVIDLNHRKRRVRIRQTPADQWQPLYLQPGNRPPGVIHVIGRYGRCAGRMEQDLFAIMGNEYKVIDHWQGYKISMATYEINANIYTR